MISALNMHYILSVTYLELVNDLKTFLSYQPAKTLQETQVQAFY